VVQSAQLQGSAINISHLAPGMYFIEAIDEKQSTRVRQAFVKM